MDEVKGFGGRERVNGMVQERKCEHSGSILILEEDTDCSGRRK
jgi:hypothetical protein